MDWIRMLKVTLGAARGLTYLHELADLPIIQRHKIKQYPTW